MGDPRPVRREVPAFMVMDQLGQQFELTQLAVLQNAPEEPGILTLHERDGTIVYVEWAEDLAQALLKHVPGNELHLALKSHARAFKFFITPDPAALAACFDKLVDATGSFPKCMPRAPEGARHQTPPGGPAPSPAPAPTPPSRKPLSSPGATGAHPSLEQVLEAARAELAKGRAEQMLQILGRLKQAGFATAELEVLFGRAELLKGRQAALAHFRKAADLDPRGAVGEEAARLAATCARKIADLED